jgi:hypothetical protein
MTVRMKRHRIKAPKAPTSRIVPALIDASTAAAQSAAIGAGPREIGVAAGAAAISSLAHVLWGRLIARREMRLRAFVRGFFDGGENADPGVIEAQIQALGDEPVVQEAVLEALRGIDDALADVVVPALARLARLYKSTKRPADAFFRGTRQVLQDLNAASFAELLSLLRTFKSEPTARRLIEADARDAPNLAHIIFLLRSNWIATEETVMRLGSSTGPLPPVERAILSKDAALQVLVILDSTEELRWIAESRP